MRKDDTFEIICWAFGVLIGLWILMKLLPYIILFLALCGAWYLWQEYGGNPRNRR